MIGAKNKLKQGLFTQTWPCFSVAYCCQSQPGAAAAVTAFTCHCTPLVMSALEAYADIRELEKKQRNRES